MARSRNQNKTEIASQMRANGATEIIHTRMPHQNAWLLGFQNRLRGGIVPAARLVENTAAVAATSVTLRR
jgi:hypothetical protein